MLFMGPFFLLYSIIQQTHPVGGHLLYLGIYHKVLNLAGASFRYEAFIR